MDNKMNNKSNVSNILFSKQNINVVNTQLLKVTKQENVSQDRKKAIFKLLITTMKTIYKQPKPMQS